MLNGVRKVRSVRGSRLSGAERALRVGQVFEIPVSFTGTGYR
jgi:hypothetical protein